MKQIKTITVFSGGQWGSGWPPSGAADAMAWFKSKLEEVPAEHRDSAKIDIDSDTEYDSSFATINITYLRHETDEEEAEREQRVKFTSDRIRAQELQRLAELQAKYGKQ